MDRIRIPSTVLARLHALGISPTDLVRQAQVPQTLVRQERMVVTTAQWFALWDALAACSTDPAFGLQLASALPGEPYDPLAITALSAATFHDALRKVARYKRLFSPEDMRIVPHGTGWSIEVVWLATDTAPPPLLIDATLAHVITVGQRGTGRAVVPERVLLRRDAQHRSMYEAYFACPVEFGAERNMLLLSDAAMRQPFSTANPELLALLEPQLDAALRGRTAQPRLIEEVKRLLQSRMAGKQPTMHEVARELHMSTRTLQRRLAAEGMAFQRLVEEVRHELAKEYLRAPALDLNEIAFLLGYQEASSFHRAFQQWEGLPPGQWRAAHR